jgi:hypothetical protein
MRNTTTTPALKRRAVFGLGAAGLVVAGTSSRALAASTGQNLKAEVTLGGKVFVFRQEDGVSLGDFVSSTGGFTQACIRVRAAGCPLTVHFRPDRNSTRAEAVFELGDVFDSVPVNLGAYTVVISRGGLVLATMDVPQHYWFSRWRWQSEIRPIKADIDALIAQNLLPPFDREGGVSTVAATQSSILPGALPNVCYPDTPLPSTDGPDTAPALPSKFTPYTVMGLSGIIPYMPQTGERSDIGVVTEPQAEYICTARQAALDVMRAQAESAGTVPWHIRDENTNAPFSLRAYPEATWYSSTNRGNPYVKGAITPVKIDSAHQPALSYVPYLLTGDPYHLEDLQFMVNWNLGSLVPQYRLSIPQSRAFAWNLRTLAQAARVTPDTVPSWLLPKHYFVGFLNDTRAYFEAEYVNSTRPERARFRVTTNIDNSRDEGPTAPKGTWTGPWEEEFVTTILGWVVAMGFTEWRRSLEWKMQSTIARASATSGWRRAYATPYRMIVRASATAAVVNSWAECWSLTQRTCKLAFSDPNTWVEDDMAYLAYTRGALVYIDKLKLWNVSENLNWATQQLRARKWATAYKWRLGDGLA